MSPTIVLLILNLFASLYAWNNQDMYYKWMMTPYKVKRNNQYYRFITSGFIHGDWMHLIFNLVALYSFGRYLEIYLFRAVGMNYQLYYYTMYFIALIVSDIPTYLKHRDNPGYNSLGASGAVSAVIFACILFAPLERIYFLPGFITGTMYLIFSYTVAKRNIGGINHDAHFYGAVCGILFIIILYPPVLTEFYESIRTWDFALIR